MFGDQSFAQLRTGFRFFIKLCMRVVDKKVNYAGLLCCRELLQFAHDPR